MREMILTDKVRIDGRDMKTIRPIDVEAGLLPRTHGSALFTRGETQVLAAVTLGTSEDEQIVDTMFQNTMRKFMLHYNFPPFSVGETGRMGGQSRREIGHGALAERSIKAMMPAYDKFPYTVRIVCETLEVQRLFLDGLGLLDLDGAHGRGRSVSEASRRHRDGSDQGRRPRRGSLRHPG